MDQTDLRRTHLEPTEEMLHGGRIHFSNTLTEAIHFLAEADLLASSPERLLIQLSHSSDEGWTNAFCSSNVPFRSLGASRAISPSPDSTRLWLCPLRR